MSAFLGPIHYWLWNKIKIQDDMVIKILKFAEKKLENTSLKDEIEKTYGALEQGPLEENINESNIHGWLQERVTLVERSLAKAVTTLLNEKQTDLAALKEIMYQYGKTVATEETFTVKSAFKFLEDTLLDGMPCDRANQLLEETDERITWKRNVCVHEEYWKEVGGDIANYYHLRESFIKGLLENTKVAFRRVDEVTSELTILSA